MMPVTLSGRLFCRLLHRETHKLSVNNWVNHSQVILLYNMNHYDLHFSGHHFCMWAMMKLMMSHNDVH